MSTTDARHSDVATGIGETQPRDSRTVVLGLGNPIMGDDGFGLAALERLRAEWSFDQSVQLVDGGTWGLSLLPIIECADQLLVLDAIRLGRPPGTFIVLEADDVPRQLSAKLSPHQVDMREVLALAQFRGTLPARIVAIGVEPEYVDLRDSLSPSVEQQLDVAVAVAVERLLEWNVNCEPVIRGPMLSEARRCTR